MNRKIMRLYHDIIGERRSWAYINPIEDIIKETHFNLEIFYYYRRTRYGIRNNLNPNYYYPNLLSRVIEKNFQRLFQLTGCGNIPKTAIRLMVRRSLEDVILQATSPRESVNEIQSMKKDIPPIDKGDDPMSQFVVQSLSKFAMQAFVIDIVRRNEDHLHDPISAGRGVRDLETILWAAFIESGLANSIPIASMGMMRAVMSKNLNRLLKLTYGRVPSKKAIALMIEASIDNFHSIESDENGF